MRVTKLNQPLQTKVSILDEINELDLNILLNEPLVAHRLKDNKNSEFLDCAFLTNVIPFGDSVVSKLIDLIELEERKSYLCYLKTLMINQKIEPLSYEVINSIGGNIGGSGTAFENISYKIQEAMFEKRGLTKSRTNYKLNFNKFVRYLLTRVHLYVIGSEFIAYDFKSGKYIHILDDFLKAQAKIILHEAEKDIWQVSYGKCILEQLRLDAKRLECIEEDTKYLNLKNGILELSDLRLYDHSPDIITLSQLPVRYDLSAKCPIFLEYLETVFEGDHERISLVQEIFGYCLTADTQLQKFFIFYGNGSNGKSVLANIMRKVIGNDNCSSSTLEQLSKQFGAQVIQDKRLNISGESDSSGNTLNTQQLKLITGEDMIQVESKFKNPIMIRPYVKLVVLSNHYPTTEDTSDGFLRRCLFIPFNVRFIEEGIELGPKEAYKDKDLQFKLDLELDGIFMWALQGYQRLKKNNYVLTQCKASDQVLKDFMIYNNPVKEFILEQLAVCPGNRVLKRDLYDTYKEWAERNNVRKIPSKEFWKNFANNSKVFKNYHYEEKKSNGNRYICNLKIKGA